MDSSKAEFIELLLEDDLFVKDLSACSGKLMFLYKEVVKEHRGAESIPIFDKAVFKAVRRLSTPFYKVTCHWYAPVQIMDEVLLRIFGEI